MALKGKKKTTQENIEFPCIAIFYCCITNHPTTYQLETAANIYHLTQFLWDKNYLGAS